MKKLLVILGPTATGKTDLALELAKKFNGELIACDSRQVYIGLDIGTGKLPSNNVKVVKGNSFWEIDGVKVWMYDVVNPHQKYNVSAYVKNANAAVDDITSRKKLPIIVGGTGLYLRALLGNLSMIKIPLDQNLRKRLEKLSKTQLQEELRKINPQKWENMNQSDRQNPRRLTRAIEIAESFVTVSSVNSLKVDVLKIGLIATREVLYKRVDQRVIKRIDQGMIEEAEKLHKNGLTLNRMKSLGLEYGVLADFLSRNIAKNDVAKILQGKIHGYVRRQLTWFKKEQGISWFDIGEEDYQKKVAKLVCKWYYPDDATQN